MIKFFLILFFITSLSYAEKNLYSFNSEFQKELCDELTYEFGCALCAGSNVIV